MALREHLGKTTRKDLGDAHDSAIGKRKTRGVVRPVLVPVLSFAKGPQRRRLVLPGDGLRGHESCVTTARHPTDDRGRNRLRVHAPWPEYHRIVENPSFFPPFLGQSNKGYTSLQWLR